MMKTTLDDKPCASIHGSCTHGNGVFSSRRIEWVMHVRYAWNTHDMDIW